MQEIETAYSTDRNLKAYLNSERCLPNVKQSIKKKGKFSLETKIRVHNFYVIPVLLYKWVMDNFPTDFFRKGLKNNRNVFLQKDVEKKMDWKCEERFKYNGNKKCLIFRIWKMKFLKEGPSKNLTLLWNIPDNGDLVKQLLSNW